jgi:hypothetical protein
MKTRAWDGERFRDDYVVMPDGSVWVTRTHTPNFPWECYDPDVYAVKVDWKLSRFTEHLDIEKNEIYENHIVKLASGSVGVVKFDNGSFVVDIKKPSGTFEFYEWPGEYFAKYDFDDGFVPGALIIGDVFTTPELLEEVTK